MFDVAELQGVLCMGAQITLNGISRFAEISEHYKAHEIQCTFCFAVCSAYMCIREQDSAGNRREEYRVIS